MKDQKCPVHSHFMMMKMNLSNHHLILEISSAVNLSQDEWLVCKLSIFDGLNVNMGYSIFGVKICNDTWLDEGKISYIDKI